MTLDPSARHGQSRPRSVRLEPYARDFNAQHRTPLKSAVLLCETVMQSTCCTRSTRETEGVGFEPTVGFPTLDFESSALNRTQPPFLSFGIVGVNLRRAIITRTSEFAKAKHHATSNRHENYAYRRGIETRSAASCQCCGTDHRSIEPLAKQAVQEA